MTATEKKNIFDKCEHENTVVERSIICIDCGDDLGLSTSTTEDDKSSYYNGRLQKRKIEAKGLINDLKNKNFDNEIIDTANQIYIDVTKHDIRRNNSRKSVIFACVHYAHLMINRVPNDEKLLRCFGISKKKGLYGIKLVKLKMSRDILQKMSSIYITPLTLVDNIMDNFNSTQVQRQDVKNIYKLVEAKNFSKINRSRPKSIAAGLVYYWILKTGKKVTIQEFANKVDMSEFTIDKLTKEIKKAVE